MKLKNYQLALLHLPFLAILLYLAFTGRSVGGDGDTIMHYFLVEQASRNPIFFFDLWGKPFFTLLAFPFVQFGFIGIKVFNVLCGTLAVFLSALSAKKLNKPHFWLIPFLAFLAPAFPFSLLSGLTEPFGALVITGTVLLFLHKKPVPAYILASLLPFCRSEAKILLLVFLVYGLVQKHYRILPLLLTGSLVYALVGGIWHGNPLWIFDSPYNAGPSVYGHGSWSHFTERLFVMTAFPAFLLLCLGLLRAIYRLFVNKTFRLQEMWLIHALFLGMFAAHTTVWALGIFASAGLERVLILVFPMMWIIMLDGLNLTLQKVKTHSAWRIVIIIFWVAFIAFGSFYNNRFTKHNYTVATRLSDEQKMVEDSIVPFIEQNYPHVNRIISDEAYLGVALGLNPKDTNHYATWHAVRGDDWNSVTDSTLVLWDNKVVPVHQGLDEAKMKTFPWLKEAKRWETPYGGKTYILYEFIEPPEAYEKPAVDSQ